MWMKDNGKSKLALAAELVRSVMAVFPADQQVILLCDSWYPKGEVLVLTKDFPQLEMICHVRSDTVLYDMPAPRTGKRRRPQIHGARLDMHSIPLMKTKGYRYYMGSRKVITNLWKGQTVYAFVMAISQEKESSYRLFVCMIDPDDILTGPEPGAEKRSRNTISGECCHWVYTA